MNSCIPHTISVAYCARICAFYRHFPEKNQAQFLPLGRRDHFVSSLVIKAINKTRKSKLRCTEILFRKVIS